VGKGGDLRCNVVNAKNTMNLMRGWANLCILDIAIK
jgi:hypothetical protein